MKDNRLLPAAVFGGILAVGMIGGGALIGQGVVNARVGDRAVTVRGLAEKDVQADLALLPLGFTASGDVLADVQAKIDADLAAVRRFLTAQGFTDAEVTVGRLTVTDLLAREYGQQNPPARFIVTQTVSVRSANVAKVQQTNRALNDLVRQGVLLQDFSGPSFIYTKLNDIRAEMIGKATASAREGAEQFAKDSRQSLGPIKEATQGYFEILPRDEGDNSGASPDQKVRVVTTITYRLR